MAIDYSFFTIAFRDTIYFNASWIVNLVASLITMLVITRDTSKWKSLAFPVTVAWHIAGLPPNAIIYVATAIMFVIDNLSLQGIGQILTVPGRLRGQIETLMERKEKIKKAGYKTGAGMESGREKLKSTQRKIKSMEKKGKIFLDQAFQQPKKPFAHEPRLVFPKTGRTLTEKMKKKLREREKKIRDEIIARGR